MSKKLEVKYVPIDSIKPYEKNPRFNEKAIDVVAKSIKDFGVRGLILVDGNMEIIYGHTRWLAQRKLGLTEVPISVADDLTPEQVKAYRIMDNKSQEYSDWNLDLLKIEMESLASMSFDVTMTGFDKTAIEVLGLSKNLGDIPDVDIKGNTSKVFEIIVIQIDNEEHVEQLHTLFNLGKTQRSIKSSEFLEILNALKP